MTLSVTEFQSRDDLGDYPHQPVPLPHYTGGQTEAQGEEEPWLRSVTG